MIEAARADTLPPAPSNHQSRRRLFIGEQEQPADALDWRSSAERATKLRAWRTGVGRAFCEAPRVIRVAWTLEWLFGRDGFAFATDSYFVSELGIHLNKVQAALKTLEDGGAIIRASIFSRGRAQRRIWPSTKIIEVIPPTLGGMDTPHNGRNIPPTLGGQNTIIKQRPAKSRGISSIAEQARRDAERRERSAAARHSAPALDGDT